MKNKIYINARFLTQSLTGVQRFAMEISGILKNDFPNRYIWVSPANIKHQEIAKNLEVEVTGDHSGHFWEQYELPKYLKKKHSPILLNLCNTAPLMYSNNISTIHDVAFYENPEWFSKRFVFIYKFLIPKIVRSSKLVFTVSEFSKNEIHKYMSKPLDQIEVVHNSVSKIFVPGKFSEERLILTVSTLQPRKNLITLINSFGEIQDESLKLVIIGSENRLFSSSKIKQIIEGDERIILTGYLTDDKLVEYYQKALIFVYTSLYEGFGIPPLEAMACGTSTIVSDIPVFRELYDDATMFFQSESDLTNKIKFLLDNQELRTDKIKRGLNLVNKYSWRTSAVKIDKILSAL